MVLFVWLSVACCWFGDECVCLVCDLFWYVDLVRVCCFFVYVCDFVDCCFVGFGILICLLERMFIVVDALTK